MSANYSASQKILSLLEGGYNSKLKPPSGETYRWIDRKQTLAASEKGKESYRLGSVVFALVDAYKAKFGVPNEEDVIKVPGLDAAVEAFWSERWNRMGFANFNNQTLAALVWAWAAQVGNVLLINKIAKSFGATQTKTYNITTDVANTLEADSARYTIVYNAMSDYYTRTRQKGFIKSRLGKFPKFLNPLATVQKKTSIWPWA